MNSWLGRLFSDLPEQQRRLVVGVAVVALLILAAAMYPRSSREKRAKSAAQSAVWPPRNRPAPAVRAPTGRPSAESLDEAAVLDEIASSLLATASRHIKAADWRNGLGIFKEVAADPAYPPLRRALAEQFLADAYLSGTRSPSVAKEVFRGEPYASFPGDGTAGYLLGTRRIYEHSLTLASLPWSHYRIAEWHADQLLNDTGGSRIPPQERSKHLARISENLRKGDAAWAGLDDRLEVKRTRLAYALWLRGRVHGSLYALKRDVADREWANADFKQAIALLRKPSAGMKTRHLDWAVLFFAVFLVDAYGEAGASDIRPLLGYLSMHQCSGSTVRFLQQLSSRPPEYAHLTESLARLARLEPSFAKLLLESGWRL